MDVFLSIIIIKIISAFFFIGLLIRLAYKNHQKSSKSKVILMSYFLSCALISISSLLYDWVSANIIGEIPRIISVLPMNFIIIAAGIFFYFTIFLSFSLKGKNLRGIFKYYIISLLIFTIVGNIIFLLLNEYVILLVLLLIFDIIAFLPLLILSISTLFGLKQILGNISKNEDQKHFKSKIILLGLSGLLDLGAILFTYLDIVLFGTGSYSFLSIIGWSLKSIPGFLYYYVIRDKFP